MTDQSLALNHLNGGDYLVAGHINIVDLGKIIFEDSSLDPNPLLHLQSGGLLHHPQHVSHLLDGHHLLAPGAHPQVTDAVNGGLDVSLLERLHVDVTLDVLGRYH